MRVRRCGALPATRQHQTAEALVTGVEYADESRSGPFPESWGTPPDGEEQRAAWVYRNVVERELPHRANLSGAAALRRLERRYPSP
jgi:hypothetical protein